MPSSPTESRLGGGVTGRGEADRHKTQKSSFTELHFKFSSSYNNLKSKALVGKEPLLKGQLLVGRPRWLLAVVTEQEGGKM